MHHASQGMRNALRKGSDVFVHHSGHNGPGGGTTANSTSRSLHLSSNFHVLSRIAQPPFNPINTLQSIRPRNPPHRLFSITKNVLQRLFTHLTTPGFRTPTYFAQGLQTGKSSLHNAAFRGNPIQNGLSFATRASLKANALRRQANMFLPRAPNTPPPRCGGITQVGLGTVRNFTTGRPIFQQVAENIPIAGRALYEVDWDFEMRNKQFRALTMAGNPKPLPKSKELSKPIRRTDPATFTQVVKDDASPSKPDFEHYFPSATAVTTFLYVPLVPRMPLPQHPVSDELTLLPLSDLGALHSSYATHKLRVKTLFTRLEQANVWSRGVSYCCYSQSLRDRIDDLDDERAGVCTNIKLAFEGWTKAEVRSAIGESGTGWCGLEEVWHHQASEELSDALSEAYFSPGTSGPSSRASSPIIPEGSRFLDPSESFVMPKLVFSSSFCASGAFGLSSSSEAPDDGLNEDLCSISSRTSSFSDFSDLLT